MRLPSGLRLTGPPGQERVEILGCDHSGYRAVAVEDELRLARCAPHDIREVVLCFCDLPAHGSKSTMTRKDVLVGPRGSVASILARPSNRRAPWINPSPQASSPGGTRFDRSSLAAPTGRIRVIRTGLGDLAGRGGE